MESNSPQRRRECTACGHELALEHTGPCPSCGGVKSRVVVSILAADEVSVAPGLSWEKRSIREFYEKHPAALGTTVVLVLASSLVGVFLAGMVGLVVGLLLSVIGSVVGLGAITKVREKTIERGS